MFTSAGQRYLGAVIGSSTFKEDYMKSKVSKWCDELANLSEIAKSQPHAAFSAYLHGQQHKYSYFAQTICDISTCFKPLDDMITNVFIPALTGFSVNESERKLLSLPVKNGGMGLKVVSNETDTEYSRSKEISAPLAAIIALQGSDLPCQQAVASIKAQVKAQKNILLQNKITECDSDMDNLTLRTIQQTREPGASNWLSALPLQRHHLDLNKSEFRDAIALRYSKRLPDMPTVCPCGEPFEVNHAMNCKRGGFVSARHDCIRDFEEKLLSQVCIDVESEPHLQPLSNEQLSAGANTSAEARLDLRARGFWRRGQNAFFDVRVTNANSNSQVGLSLNSTLKKHEQEKKRQYNERVMQIETGTFTPLVFSTV